MLTVDFNLALEVKFTVVVGFARPMMDKITGRAPPSHEPTYNTPRRVRYSHGLENHPG